MSERLAASAAPAPMPQWHCAGFRIDLTLPRIMGIVNVTPDSFSDGGRYGTLDSALAHAHQLAEEGADILDIGGESTRPGAPDVPVEEELRRVVPVVQALRALKLPLSVDTSKPEVMRAALDAGAAIINDVRALQWPGALDVVAASDCGVVLMHMQGTPRSMQNEPHYDDVVREVGDFLQQRRAAVRDAGVADARVMLDPGFGFGKTVTHNLALLAALDRLPGPLLVGLSRKSTLGQITGRPVNERLVASVSAALLAVQRGGRVVRVHDVAATRDALRVWSALNDIEKEKA